MFSRNNIFFVDISFSKPAGFEHVSGWDGNQVVAKEGGANHPQMMVDNDQSFESIVPKRNAPPPPEDDDDPPPPVNRATKDENMTTPQIDNNLSSKPLPKPPGGAKPLPKPPVQ